MVDSIFLVAFSTKITLLQIKNLDLRSFYRYLDMCSINCLSNILKYLSCYVSLSYAIKSVIHTDRPSIFNLKKLQRNATFIRSAWSTERFFCCSFQLKELEKMGPKKGVISQSVKDVIQSLVDDDLVLKDKIGSSVRIFCWINSELESDYF